MIVANKGVAISDAMIPQIAEAKTSSKNDINITYCVNYVHIASGYVKKPKQKWYKIMQDLSNAA